MDSSPATLRQHSSRSTPPEWVVLVFALAVFVSAFLLFQVEPLISKFILPWFGGAPSVWTTAVLFFQLVLFLGYAYAHVTSRLLGLRGQALVHIGILVIALLTLPVIPSEAWKPDMADEPTWRILGLLTATVGLPYFVLSATGPLLQAWFAAAYLGRTPYRLYALSNVGSLLALLTYPCVFEPLFELPRQAWLWSAGFVVYALTVGWCATWGLRAARWRPHQAESHPPLSESPAEKESAPSWLRRALWLLLPAFGSLMLLATTNRVCQEVAAVPFLWIVPLSLYLLTFVVCFDHQRWYRRELFGFATAALVFLTAGSYELDFVHAASAAIELSLYFATMFGSCMLCHGELVRLRPAPRYLTEFYLLMSAGGAVGGVVVTLVAPRLFTTFYEWSLGLIVAFALAVWTSCNATAEAWLRRPVDSPRAWFTRGGARWCCSGLLVAGSVAGYFVAVWSQPETGFSARARNFYGVVSVWEADEDDPALHHFTFFSGRIRHGQQFAETTKQRLPTTYYAEHTGVGRALAYAGWQGPLRVGLVGLGVGTLATYARPGDLYRFYEINPEVTQMARRWFTYLRDCQGRCEVVEGDARLLLERETDEPFDVLVLDAFSGDAPPVHLLTREAFQIYLRRLKPRGLLVVHITNSYLYLAPVVQRLADHLQLRSVRIVTPQDKARLLCEADYLVLTQDSGFIAETPAQLPDPPDPDVAAPLWTDHYSNLFQMLRRS
jgi:hypothetical protein